MTFLDIVNQIEEALFQRQYGEETISNWNENFSDGEFVDHWRGYYVTDLFELQSFLQACVIFNGTENQVILHATQIALNNQK